MRLLLLDITGRKFSTLFRNPFNKNVNGKQFWRFIGLWQDVPIVLVNFLLKPSFMFKSFTLLMGTSIN